jgi:hypothetical protein
VTHYNNHITQNASVHELSEYQTLRNLQIYITAVKLAAMWKWKTFLKLQPFGFCWSNHQYKIQSHPQSAICTFFQTSKLKPIILHRIQIKNTIIWISSTIKICTVYIVFLGGLGGCRYLYSGKNNLHPTPVEKPLCLHHSHCSLHKLSTVTHMSFTTNVALTATALPQVSH